jgi:hypothetical protein
MNRIGSALLLVALSAATASAGSFEIAAYGGRALPTYNQSFSYNPTLSGLPQGVTVTQQGALTLDAKGGTAFAGAATWYLAGPLGIEGRIDSIGVKADVTGARFQATASFPGLPSVSGSVDFPPGVVTVDRLRPVSLNLKLRTPGPLRFTISGGVSYLSELKAVATQPLGLGVTGISGGRLQVASLALRADSQAIESGKQGKIGANAGAGIQLGLGPNFALVAEARGFLFKKRRVVWSAGQAPRNQVEQALLDEVLRRLDPVEFNPTSYQVTGGVALSF